MPAEHGCLLINAAGAPVARDADVARVIDDYRAELHDAIARGIAAAVPAASVERRAPRRRRHRPRRRGVRPRAPVAAKRRARDGGGPRGCRAAVRGFDSLRSTRRRRRAGFAAARVATFARCAVRAF
jgi:hypothetical protein